MGYTTSMILLTVSTAMSVISAFNQSSNEQSQLEYQSSVSDYESEVALQNALIAEEQGFEEVRTGYENKLQKRIEVASLIGDQRAAQSASGAVIDSGSMLDVQLDTAQKGEADAIALEQAGFDAKYTQDVAAYNYLNQSQAYSAQSSYYSDSADDINPWLSAGSTLISSAASIGSNYALMS